MELYTNEIIYQLDSIANVSKDMNASIPHFIFVLTAAEI